MTPPAHGTSASDAIEISDSPPRDGPSTFYLPRLRTILLPIFAPSATATEENLMLQILSLRIVKAVKEGRLGVDGVLAAEDLEVVMKIGADKGVTVSLKAGIKVVVQREKKGTEAEALLDFRRAVWGFVGIGI
jgi:hypothetical protein